MNRVTRKINTDGDPQQSNASDLIIGYSTCGCAGGLVTTIRGEEIIEKDWSGNNPTSMGRRTQKIYQDILGRTFKSEVMKWNGTDVYLRTETDFNGRDHAIEVDQMVLNDAQNPIVQTTTMGYDGHGRMISRHIPQQDTQTETAYSYNPDDSVATIVDARGASTIYDYNSRGLVEELSWSVPSGEPQIDDTTTVYFQSDNLGNRTLMTDGLGTVAYEYDSLSRMTAETRDFTDTLSSAPNGVFRLEYTYTLLGQLKSLEDPYGDTINYAHDKVGRLSTVTGSSFAGVTSYASNTHYRAWGGLQSLSYSNGTTMSMTFNNRLQADSFSVVKSGQQTPILSKTHSFYADGSLRKVDDLVDDKFDQLNTFDNGGRPKSSVSSFTARGETPGQQQIYDTPYEQTYSYNAFDNLTLRDHRHWNTQDQDVSSTYLNNRVTNTGFEHDADGRETRTQRDQVYESTYDAAGRLIVYNRNDEFEAERLL